jgi:hypothetical protein
LISAALAAPAPATSNIVPASNAPTGRLVRLRMLGLLTAR